MTETAAKRNYKKTLNLPRTSFPMRANLAQNEAGSTKRWGSMNLYERITEARATGHELFIFHDGPPYANGSLHVGHLLNKVLKDIVVRSQLLMGKACPFVPGWDCHGLPIEHRVMTKLVESGKADKLDALDEDTRRMAVRRECETYAEKHVKLHTRQLHHLLTLADYANPYLTMHPSYERAVLEVFAEMIEQGIVYRDLKPVHWSIANQTALAEAELEYRDREDLSVYVDFEAADKDAVGKAFGVELDATPSFMIWTTTPWTLPANLAIAVHDRFRYALVQVDGNVTVLASELVEKVTSAAGADSVEILAETDGASLVGLRYRHAFCDRDCPVVAADYVTLEDGTGLVHTAPGHGAEDYMTGLKEGIDIYCPVQDDGTYDDTVPEWLRGMNVWDANTAVTEHLRESGHLFYDHTFVHSYPHDWRSKTPVIFRGTEQWFVAVDKPTTRDGKSLREMALAATGEEITFYPGWGQNRLRGMLESRPDWCLSRQRAWGLPIPAFAMPDGGVFLTAASVRAIAVEFAKRGADAWFSETPAELLASYDASADPEAPEAVRSGAVTPDDLHKTYDIFDVWFESGSSWNAVMRERDLGCPVDLYLEGSDQHRGWFQLSLLPGLGMTGHSPFKSVLTHGFMVDKDGRKMSKSGDNALDFDHLLETYGADVCRWWVSSLPFENDIKVDLEFFDLAGDAYRKVRNTLRFLLSNLQDFEPCTDENSDGMCVDLSMLGATSLDAWVVEAARTLQDDVLEAYRTYEFRRANQLLYDFCNETLSAFYCAAMKDRLYCDASDAPRRRATQTVMWDLLEVLTRLLAPIMPHTADEAYRALWQTDPKDTERTVHGLSFAAVPAVTIDDGWPAVLAARSEAMKALEEAKARGIENPLDAAVTLPDKDGVLARFADEWPDLLGVSRVSFDAEATEIAVADVSKEPACERCWRHDPTTTQRSDGGALCERCAGAVGV
jgi:isoleucyl-tRNA synthetase